MLIYIVLNGSFNTRQFYEKLFNNLENKIIIGVDGGNNFLHSINIKPNYVTGDFDSINPEILDKYKKNKNIKIVFKDNQDETDLQFSISLAKTLKPNKIVILGAIGDRFDHIFSNILSLIDIEENIETIILDEKNEIRLVRNEIKINGNIGDIISVFPITKVDGLKYEGLKWNVNNININIGWIGISNEMISNVAKINLEKGIIVVCRTFTNGVPKET
ncbi:MAG TPA: thiamine diphosphokinase [Rickettsiales bacterium]|nr:thiamine diphosphokinase [Rickettsiales bacterium]